MAKSPRNDHEIERDTLALAPPRVTVLSDQALLAEHAHLDSLKLAIKLGPVYDILRHPATVTPLAVAVYGDWGTGKTSAMRWLEGLLREWNANGKHGKNGEIGKVVRPVWFYPWKYHRKEDVWRGLIAEVILASIMVRGATMGRVKEAVKRFGLFLGRSFLHALTSMKLTEHVDARSLQELYDDYQKTIHPEAGYLNEFETTLSKWIENTVSSEGERMVIFIDDLDRCLPDVALQVLEALKLYLNIKDLIFVVGVDRMVIDQLIRKLYTDVGLDEHKSKHYLAKMFQVEVSVGPTEQQAESFLDEQLEAMGVRSERYRAAGLGDLQIAIFRRVILRLAQRNPREIKRLLNSLVIHGAGVLHMPGDSFKVAQGMQVFLVRRLLDERYTMGLTVDTRRGMEFFHRWSMLVRSGELPIGEQAAEAAESSLAQAVPPEDAQRFEDMLHLLHDPELSTLMQIEYPADTTLLASVSPRELPKGLIVERIARARNKRPSEVDTDDFRHITELALTDEEITDLSSLHEFPELRRLTLEFTQVADIRPLRALTKLESLSLSGTRVKDLSPLCELVGLRALWLNNASEVSDFSPLSRLTNLQTLQLNSTRISDLNVLAPLERLEILSLANTAVTDLTPLAKLIDLQSLSVAHTRVTDLTPLHALSRLRKLYVQSCNVQTVDLEALMAANPGVAITYD